MSKTVNTYGQFKPFTTVKEYEDYPKSEWSDMDWIAYTVLKRVEKEYKYLDSKDIFYYDFRNPERHPEPKR